MPKVPQPVTDDSVRVRQVNHYQFSWVAGEPGQAGTFTLQLVLDQGAWEEIVTVTAEDADVLQDLLAQAEVVYFAIGRRTLMFAARPAGQGQSRSPSDPRRGCRVNRSKLVAAATVGQSRRNLAWWPALSHEACPGAA